MDFYSAQDASRRTTRKLVVLFILAVVSIITLTNLLIMAAAWYSNTHAVASGFSFDFFSWSIFWKVGLLVSLVVSLGSLFKILSLKGGASVAEMVGCERLRPGDGDADSQKLSNVVEEMAIAAGTPVPPVYLMRDESINAFAAGYGMSDAVIGVTEGAMRKLTREQLQGVIAHEFSHILNGDMRLNMRLIGLLHGITLIGEAGRALVYSSGREKSRGNSLAGVGLGLLAIGFIGVFFGNLIRAGVSRQREFLADASAVQFTRDTNGISGALIRIGSDSRGSVLNSQDVRQVSHLLFASGIRSKLGGFLATHPPLDVRIKRITPQWNGDFVVSVAQKTTRQPLNMDAPGLSGANFAAGELTSGITMVPMGDPGGPETRNFAMQAARELRSALPKELLDAAHNAYAARALIYGLLLDEDPANRKEQLGLLKSHADFGVHDLTLLLYSPVRRLDATVRIPLVELILPCLHALSLEQYRIFKQNLDRLVNFDRKVSLFEWSLKSMVTHNLDRVLMPGRVATRGLPLSECADACSVVLSFLAHAVKRDDVPPAAAFAQGVALLPEVGLSFIDRNGLSLNELEAASYRVARLHPLKKPQFLKACASIITSDGRVSTAEGELYRALGAVMDCPMPLLVDDAAVQVGSQ